VVVRHAGRRGSLAVSDADGTLSNNHTVRPETQQWQELAIGGPVVRNKMWFFTSFQYWQEDVGSLFNDSVRQGDRYHGQVKLSWQASPVNTLVLNVATDPSLFKNSITDARYAEGTNYDQTQGGYFVQVRDTHNLSATTFLETQFFVHHNYLTARPSEDGLGPFTMTIAPGAPISYTGTYPNDQDRSSYRYRANTAVTSQLGSHRLKAGLDYSFMEFTGINRTDDITLNLDAYVAGYGPGSQYSITYDYNQPDVTDRRDSEVAAFAQDTWILDEHWSLEAGVRVDRQSILGTTNVAPRAGVSMDPAGDGKSKAYANWAGSTTTSSPTSSTSRAPTGRCSGPPW